VCFRPQIATGSERYFFGSRFSVALLSSLSDFATEMNFGRRGSRGCNPRAINTELSRYLLCGITMMTIYNWNIASFPAILTCSGTNAGQW